MDSAHNDRIAGPKEIACNKRIAGLEIFCLRRSKGHKELACNDRIALTVPGM